MNGQPRDTVNIGPTRNTKHRNPQR